MKRPYEPDHEEFRTVVREYFKRVVEPHYLDWEEQGIIDRSAWKEAGRAGILGLMIPEEYGGLGMPDFRMFMVIDEEGARGGFTSLMNGFNVNDNIIAPYIVDLGTEEQKRCWLPGMADGSVIAAIAMTEPGAGSDLQGMRTSAIRDGDEWVINGAKTFITNGIHADVVIVAARTDPNAGSRGFSLFLVPSGTPGFERGRKLDKVGLRSQDTAELFFSDVRVPAAALLGQEGRGLIHLMERLPRERLGICSMATASIRAAFEWTANYAFERSAFGEAIGEFQATRFALAELSADVDVAESYLDRCALAINDGELSAVEAARAKLFLSELQNKVTTRCLQLFGGYGYMLEFPIARAFRDSRITTIYGGTSEIMKEIVGRDIANTYASGGHSR